MPCASVRLLLSCALFTAIQITRPAPACAADALTGKIVDPDGRPVAGARVIVTGEGLPLVSVLSGDGGDFEVDAPAHGRLTLRVVTDGFRAASMTLDAARSSPDLGTITLAVSAVSESVVVSASQVEIPLTEVSSSVTVISGAELETRQLHSVADALRT